MRIFLPIEQITDVTRQSLPEYISLLFANIPYGLVEPMFAAIEKGLPTAGPMYILTK